MHESILAYKPIQSLNEQGFHNGIVPLDDEVIPLKNGIYWDYWRMLCIMILMDTTFCRDLSYNDLSGEIPNNGSFSLFTPIRYYHALCHVLLSCVLIASKVFEVKMIENLLQNNYDCFFLCSTHAKHAKVI